jgi:AcrR family transcriptional regulator
MDDTKSRLLDAAGQVFAEKGFEAASVREICQRADANIAAVNYHFGDKRRMYIEAVSQAQCSCESMNPMPEWPADIAPEARLRGFLRVMLERMLEENRPRWHLELMLRELANPTEACAHVVEAYIRPLAEQLRAIVLDMLPPGMPEERRWMIGFSIVGQVLFYYVNRPIIRLLIGDEAYRSLTIDRLAEHIADFSLAALGFRAPLREEAGPTALEETAS